jgi:hypothetical protein
MWWLEKELVALGATAALALAGRPLDKADAYRAFVADRKKARTLAQKLARQAA